MSDAQCPKCKRVGFDRSITGMKCTFCGYEEQSDDFDIDRSLEHRKRDQSSRLRAERGASEGGIDELWPRRDTQ